MHANQSDCHMRARTHTHGHTETSELKQAIECFGTLTATFAVACNLGMHAFRYSFYLLSFRTLTIYMLPVLRTQQLPHHFMEN